MAKRNASSSASSSSGKRSGSARRGSGSSRSGSTSRSGGGSRGGGGSSRGGGGRGRSTGARSITTTDHEQIREWAESRGGKPACVRGTGGGADTGMLRIDFPGYSGQESLQPIEWREWFNAFDENGLALIYQDKTAGGQQSRFNKLVSRDQSDGGSGGGGGRSRGGKSSGGRGAGGGRSGAAKSSRGGGGGKTRRASK